MKKFIFLGIFIAALGTLILFFLPAQKTISPRLEVKETSWENTQIENALLLPLNEKWKGDFDGMRERRKIRVLVPHSRTFYFLDGAKEEGIGYQSAKAFETWINKKYKTEQRKIHVVMIPVSWKTLLPMLKEGKGDIAIGSITITPEREKKYDFSVPLASGVREILITPKDGPAYTTLDDLAGTEISVRPGSSYAEHIKKINKTNFKEKGLKPIKIVNLDESLGDEDILEMVNAGLIKATVVDGHMAQIWGKTFENVLVQKDIAVNEGGDLAWAFREDSPLLKAEIDDFAKTHKQGTVFGNSLIHKYLYTDKLVKNALASGEMQKFNEVVDIFKKYGDEYDFDYLMLVAQGYQESRLNQKARSHRGAVGIMQLLQSTANDPAVNVKDIAVSKEKNILAGTKYMRYLADHYVNDPGISDRNKILMSFAAYNAGPGNLNKFRKHAKESGLDPNVWFDNVEISASRIVGQETVQYVSNIYKYYVAYKLIGKDKDTGKDKAP